MSVHNATKVKATLLQLIADMNEAGRDGTKIEFNIETDGLTLQSKLGKFDVFQRLKLDH